MQAEERAARDAAAAARTDAAAAGFLKEKGAKLEAELQVRFEECVDVNDCLLALSPLLPLVVVAAVVVIMLFCFHRHSAYFSLRLQEARLQLNGKSDELLQLREEVDLTLPHVARSLCASLPPLPRSICIIYNQTPVA